MTVLEIVARSPLLALSYLLPGWLILRATGLPRSLAAAFSLSASVIYVLSVGLGIARSRLTFSLIGLSLTIVCIALAFVKLPQEPLAALLLLRTKLRVGECRLVRHPSNYHPSCLSFGSLPPHDDKISVSLTYHA